MNLRVTLCQLPIEWENNIANLIRIKHLVDNHTAKSDLIILPETFTTGFSMSVEKLAETMNGMTVAWMHEMAATRQAIIMGSIIVKEDKRYYNRIIVMSPDGTSHFYDKRHLFRMSGEYNHFTRGGRRLIVPVNNWNIYPLVCYDLRFPVWSRNRNDYDVLIYIANWPETRKDVWKSLLKARAIENYCYVIGVNRTGTDGQGISYRGDSMVIDFKGRVLVNLADETECLYTLELDHDKLATFRQKFPVFLDADDFIIR
jgi:predicted amidohydrolase